MMGRDERTSSAAPRKDGAGAVTYAASAVRDSYRRCEAITRERAGNFYWGIRLLPAPKRRAMCAVYAFARRVDDIGDGELAPDEKLRRLEQQAASVTRLAGAGVPDVEGSGGAAAQGNGGAPGAAVDPVMIALADARRCFPISPAALGELIDGVRMDVEGTSYERFEDLLPYCRRVAGAIGRLCLAVFDAAASQGGSAPQLADELGVAMQLTNILRDLREDAQVGRVYLPMEDLRRFGLADAHEPPVQALRRALDAIAGEGNAGAGAAAGSPQSRSDELSALVRFEAERALEFFERGLGLARQLDRRSAACVLAMAGIYQRLLARIAADPARAVGERVALAPWEKAWVAATSMVGSNGAGRGVRRARETVRRRA
jgi:phytoene synthase